MNKDNRQDTRHPFVAEVDYVGGGIRQRGRTSDLSQGGIFIDTINPMDEGCLVSFRFLLPGDPSGEPITGEGVVAWKQPMMGMGVRFTRISDRDRERVLQFLNTP